ncbi:unnamed protein product [Fraxinus pennsylvanica]|uniref:F-box associated beta-propeller type 1 domain-containing protein n=1 Tax=Fraxinus pennsylvanica TaxID=56036 RepID=A0AAD2E5H3_9LAMI|nr:unnamed protein product [Fraxinus pennsylvanica]
MYGLAYDSISHHYKVLKVIGPELISYSLKDDSWRRIEDIKYETVWSWDDCNLVNGAFHWIASLDEDIFRGPFVIVSLEITEEKYKELEQPPSIPRLADETLFRLTVLRESFVCTATYLEYPLIYG